MEVVKIFLCSKSMSNIAKSYRNCLSRIWKIDAKFIFSCQLYVPSNPTRTLEQLGIQTCSSYYSDSNSASISMRFCNTHRAAASKIITGDCCQTNNFGYYNAVDFQNGKLTKIDGNVMNTQTNKLDDGGEQLGECEGFEITGSEVFATGMKIFILQKAKGATFVNDLHTGSYFCT